MSQTIPCSAELLPLPPHASEEGEANKASHIQAPGTAKKPVSPGSLCPLVVAGFTAMCCFGAVLYFAAPPPSSLELPLGQGAQPRVWGGCRGHQSLPWLHSHACAKEVLCFGFGFVFSLGFPQQ